MSSFIEAILKATVGLLVNKGRNVAAEKLKDGDVTNEQLRNLIVSELDDIKSKLDGIARKDLLASISFYKEGLVYLYKVKPNEEDGNMTQQREERAATPLQQEVGSSQAARVKIVSLVEEMRSLQMTGRDSASARALNDAKGGFKQARKKATQAFCNEALSTSDRILAMQYRIMATILEKVDRVPDALAACRLCLEELHSMPAVQKSLDIHLQQGFKARFNKAEREDTIRSVCRMNRVIFHIAEIVQENIDISLWPCIDRGEDKVDPLRDVRVTQTIDKEDPQYSVLKTWPFFQEGEETMNFRCWFITIKSMGQLMISATDDDVECVLLKLFDRYGNLLQSRQLKLPVTERGTFYRRRVIGIASDRANKVFLLTRILIQGRSVCETVILFDQHANFQHEFDVDRYSVGSCIAVSDDSKVFVSVKVGMNIKRGCVLVHNFNGEPLNRIGEPSLGPVGEITSIDSEGGRIVLLASDLDSFMPRYVYQFSEQGNFLSRYNVSSNGTGEIRLLHKREHVVELDFSNENLLLYNKDGRVVREIKLKLSVLATDKRTGKIMIAIL